MATLGDLVRLGRPHFLVGGIAFVALGAALAHKAGAALDPWSVALTQLAVTWTQWGVHYANEAGDVEADRANASRTWLAGGTGLIVAGRVPRETSLHFAWTWFALAAAAISLLGSRHPWTLVCAGPLLGLAWAYSDPYLRLAWRGWGEAATGLIVAGLVPGTVLLGAGIHPTGAAAGLPWFSLAPLVLQVAAFVVVLSLPDEAGDRAVGKRTLAVRWPGRPVRVGVQAVWLLCGLATTAAVLRGAPLEAILAGGVGAAAAIGLPVLVLRRWWTVAAGYALAVVVAQWAVTLRWALA